MTTHREPTIYIGNYEFKFAQNTGYQDFSSMNGRQVTWPTSHSLEIPVRGPTCIWRGWWTNWNFHTVCLAAVWPADNPLDNRPFVLGLTCLCFVLGDFLSLKGDARTNIDFSLMSKTPFQGQNHNLQKDICKFKTWIEFEQKYLFGNVLYSDFCFVLFRFLKSTLWCPLWSN